MARDNPKQHKWFKPFDIGVAVACCKVDKIEYCKVDKIEYD